MNITTIGFEGMHRTGKGTQINKLKEYLESIGKKVFVIRGDGSRKGNNDPNYYDPESEYFKEFTKNKHNKSIDDWKDASIRIQRELYLWYKKYYKKNKDETIILIDRSVISRAILDGDISNETLLKYTIKSGKEKDRLLPDVIFSLEADTKTLLKRFSSDENYAQSIMRKKNIIEKNENYKSIVQKLPKEIKEKILKINASKNPEEVFEEIKEKLKTILFN